MSIIIEKPEDEDLSRIFDKHGHRQVYLEVKAVDPLYTLTRSEVEIIARHRGLIPECTPVRKPLPSGCKTAHELVKQYKGVKLRWTGWLRDGHWAKPTEVKDDRWFFCESNFENREVFNIPNEWGAHTWELYDQFPKKEKEPVSEPALPEITAEQHYAIWKTTFDESFKSQGCATTASIDAQNAVDAFRKSLKGGGE